MMGKISRTRGVNFERKIAARLRKQWPNATVRRTLQAHRAYESDIVVEAGPECAAGIWWELTDSASPNPKTKYEQAMRDINATGSPKTPVVVWHKKGAQSIQATVPMRMLPSLVPFRGQCPHWESKTLITLDFEDFLDLIGGDA